MAGGGSLTAWWQHPSGFDDEWLAELLRQPLAHRARDEISCAADSPAKLRRSVAVAVAAPI
jgi:hypothetical protein